MGEEDSYIDSAVDHLNHVKANSAVDEVKSMYKGYDVIPLEMIWPELVDKIDGVIVDSVVSKKFEPYKIKEPPSNVVFSHVAVGSRIMSDAFSSMSERNKNWVRYVCSNMRQLVLDEDDMHIVCSWQGYEIHLADGRNVCDPNIKLQRFDVVQRDGAVYVVV